MQPLVLTFDVGSQSVRALLVNKKGEIELSSKLKYEPHLKSEIFGRAEQKPDFYYNSICKVAKALKKQDKDGSFFERIKAVTITCIRDTMVVLDKENKPLRNIIVWMDNRRAPGEPKPSFLTKLLLASVGMTETIKMLYKDAFFNWVKDVEPDVYAKAGKFLMLPSYINYQLTGALKDGVANQVGHIPFDNRNRKWLKSGIPRCVVGIPHDMLVDLVETGEVVGKINKETSLKSGIPEGLPLLATGTDKGCEALGLSVIGEGKAAVSFGTSATIQFCSDHYFEPFPFLPSYPSVIPGRFNGETQIYRGYWTLKWFIEQFCPDEDEKTLDGYLDQIPVGCNGLMMTPHLAPGANNPFAKGTFIGLSDRHTKMHLYRAIIEGINFELIHCMKQMEKRSGQQIKEIYVAGGGSQSDKVLQITADMFGLPVKRIQTHEATGIGSSLAAFVGLGEFKTYEEACMSMVHDKDIFMPNSENYKKYKQLYENVYRKIEKTNTSIFRAIGKAQNL